jgi:hypothetical protein
VRAETQLESNTKSILTLPILVALVPITQRMEKNVSTCMRLNISSAALLSQML